MLLGWHQTAAYMGHCFDALKILTRDQLLHFKCWAHKLNLVADVFMKELKDLNFIVSKVKMAFLHFRKMKSAYLQFLEVKKRDEIVGLLQYST